MHEDGTVNGGLARAERKGLLFPCSRKISGGVFLATRECRGDGRSGKVVFTRTEWIVGCVDIKEHGRIVIGIGRFGGSPGAQSKVRSSGGKPFAGIERDPLRIGGAAGVVARKGVAKERAIVRGHGKGGRTCFGAAVEGGVITQDFHEPRGGGHAGANLTGRGGGGSKPFLQLCECFLDSEFGEEGGAPGLELLPGVSPFLAQEGEEDHRHRSEGGAKTENQQQRGPHFGTLE